MSIEEWDKFPVFMVGRNYVLYERTGEMHGRISRVVLDASGVMFYANGMPQPFTNSVPRQHSWQIKDDGTIEVDTSRGTLIVKPR